MHECIDEWMNTRMNEFKKLTYLCWFQSVSSCVFIQFSFPDSMHHPPVSETTCGHPLTPPLCPPAPSGASASSSPSPSQTAFGPNRGIKQMRRERSGRKEVDLIVGLVGTCCSCWILPDSLVISSFLSLAWLSRRRSCFFRSGTESKARSTGRLRSRIWAHNSSFCFWRRVTSNWLS